jgi:2-oxoglutarate dehydrogenase E2 component (dihydrolipoamide succinyltransferase)
MPTTLNVDVPGLGESVREAVLIRWHKRDGERVAADEPLCELETEKANVDVPSPGAGVLKRIAKEGATVKIGDTIATIDPAGKPSAAPAPAKPSSATPTPRQSAASEAREAPPRLPPERRAPAPASSPSLASSSSTAILEDFSPAVRHLLDEHKLDPSIIPSSGPNGRLTKEDILRYLETHDDRADDVDLAPAAPVVAESAPHAPHAQSATSPDGQGVRREKMSKIRKKIAERLVQAQHTAAILTTFNEVDLSRVIELRKSYKEQFEKVHGVGLGFMSFFAKACALALHQFPRVNAFIEGEDIVYHDYVHLGIAVSTDRGLAVPVLRNVHAMSFAKIESEIKRLAAATRDGKLGLEELSGGTFTITNGGIFGSLLATPILNPPQSAILGMHKIEERPIAVQGKVEIRPMMYVALSYDHRLIDGRESVSFLVRVKELLEDPSRLMLEV